MVYETMADAGNQPLHDRCFSEYGVWWAAPRKHNQPTKMRLARKTA
jgi:hypothetical protein